MNKTAIIAAISDLSAAAPTSYLPEASKTKPAYEVRLGRVKATLWANAGEHGPFYNTVVARIYKDSDGKWQESASFGRDDLPILQEVLRLAYLWQFDQGNEKSAL